MNCRWVQQKQIKIKTLDAVCLMMRKFPRSSPPEALQQNLYTPSHLSCPKLSGATSGHLELLPPSHIHTAALHTWFTHCWLSLPVSVFWDRKSFSWGVIYANLIIVMHYTLLFFFATYLISGSFSLSSHTDVGASDSPWHCVLCPQCSLWRPEPAARSPRYREHHAGGSHRRSHSDKLVVS